jgi:signal transduction histidine kinase
VSLNGTGDGVALSIADDGVGFDTAARARSGLGLVGIAERVRELGGSFNIDAGVGKGAKLSIVIPIEESRAGKNASAAGG